MTWTIVKKEILENLTTYRFAILTSLLAVLMLVSIIVSTSDYRLRLENYSILRPGQNSPNVMIPPNPFSIFVKGLDANLGRLYQIDGLGISVQSNQQSVNRLFALFTVPDMLFVVKVMLALIAVLFTFDVFCGEKEQGTLKLILASGARRLDVLIGKLAGRFALVFVPFFILCLVCSIAVPLFGDVPSDAFYWQRILVFLASSGLYALAFCGLGLVVSSLVQRSATAMISGLALWVTLVFIIPNFGTTIARSIASVPSADRVEMESRLASIRFIFEKVQKEGQRGGGGMDYVQMVQQIRDARSGLMDRYRPSLNRFINVTKGVLRFSPSGTLTFLVTDMANTGLSEELRLKDAIVQFTNRNFDRINQIDRTPIDNFVYTPASLGDILAGPALLDVFLLTAFPFLCIGISLVTFSRYDPR